MFQAPEIRETISRRRCHQGFCGAETFFAPTPPQKGLTDLEMFALTFANIDLQDHPGGGRPDRHARRAGADPPAKTRRRSAMSRRRGPVAVVALAMLIATAGIAVEVRGDAAVAGTGATLGTTAGC